MAGYKATKKLRDERVLTGYGSTEIANELGINVGNYSRIESGQRGMSPATAQRIAEVLGLTLRTAVKRGIFKIQ